MFVTTSIDPLKLVCKNSLLLDNLMLRIDDTMFDNSFVDQHRFDYFKPSDNENDETLDLNVLVNIDDNIDNDVDIDYELTPYILEFKDASGSSSIVSHD
jgi:hypothetical protein